MGGRRSVTSLSCRSLPLTSPPLRGDVPRGPPTFASLIGQGARLRSEEEVNEEVNVTLIQLALGPTGSALGALRSLHAQRKRKGIGLTLNPQSFLYSSL